MYPFAWEEDGISHQCNQLNDERNANVNKWMMEQRNSLELRKEGRHGLSFLPSLHSRLHFPPTQFRPPHSSTKVTQRSMLRMSYINSPPLCSFTAASHSFSHLRGTKHVHPAKPRCGFGRKGGMKVAPPAPFSLSFSQYLTYKGLQYLILKRKGVGLCWLKGI